MKRPTTITYGCQTHGPGCKGAQPHPLVPFSALWWRIEDGPWVRTPSTMTLAAVADALRALGVET